MLCLATSAAENVFDMDGEKRGKRERGKGKKGEKAGGDRREAERVSKDSISWRVLNAVQTAVNGAPAAFISVCRSEWISSLNAELRVRVRVSLSVLAAQPALSHSFFLLKPCDAH